MLAVLLEQLVLFLLVFVVIVLVDLQQFDFGKQRSGSYLCQYFDFNLVKVELS